MALLGILKLTIVNKLLERYFDEAFSLLVFTLTKNHSDSNQHCNSAVKMSASGN